jgi:DNA mismatch repair protein MutS
VMRAEAVLAVLERGEQTGALARLADDLPLFRAAPQKKVASAGLSPLEVALVALEPDTLSPRDALELIYKLKTLCPVRENAS